MVIRWLIVAALFCCGIPLKADGSARHQFRILYWNIQNGMWDGQRDDYARFVDFVKLYDPDLCIWCEAQSIYKTASETERLAKSERYLPNGWNELASRYGHTNVFVGGHRDSYPQVITSKLQLNAVKRIVGPKDKPIRHGAGWATVEVGGKTINVVSLHTWPQRFAPGVVGSAEQKKSKAAHGGDLYRRYELEQICRETINTSINASNEYWVMAGDFNSLTRADNHAYKLAEDDAWFLPHDFMQTTGYKDVLNVFHPGVMIPSCNSPRRIDFVYMTQSLLDCVKRADIVVDSYTKPVRTQEGSFCIPSDHLPIVVDLEL